VKILICLTFVVSLFGCASPPYVEPSQGASVAYLDYRIKASPSLGYTALLSELNDKSSRGCFASRRKMANINIGNPLDSKTNNPQGIRIPANKPFSLTTIFAPANVFGQTGCRLNVTFIPEQGASYILETIWDNSCVSKVYKRENETENEVASKQDGFFC
jgi:hypothetical protein